MATEMKYKVVSGYKPGTTEVILRPLIAERESIGGVRLVREALTSGNCRGQVQDILGQLNGFTESMQAICESGHACTMSSWIRLAPMLTGSVGEERKLTAANRLKVTATSLTDMKKALDEFTWTNINDSGVKVKVNSVVYVGGAASGYLKKGKQANLTGRYLQFDAALGDTLTISAASLATPVSVTPTESDYSHIRFALPSAVAALADNAELTITLTSRGGVTGASSQVNAKTAVLLAADPAPTMTKCYAESNPSAENHIQCFEEINDLIGTSLNLATAISYHWMSGGEEPVPMSETGTITSKTSTLLKFKMPEVQFGTNGTLKITYPDGTVELAGVEADMPE